MQWLRSNLPRSADKIARCVADLTLQLFVIMLCHFLFLRCLVNCGLKVVPQVKLSIQSQCQGSLCSNISSYEWILYEQSSSSANNGIWIRKQHLQLITETPLGSSNIVIKKGSLSGRTNYRLALFVQTTAGLPGMSAYDISTTSAPTGGTCTITPSCGISLKTDFNLTCSNWKSDSIPLSYQFQYQLENGLDSMLFHGFNNTVSSWLPPGNLSENFTVKVKVIITDYVGASAAVTNLSVQVRLYVSSCFGHDVIRTNWWRYKIMISLRSDHFCEINTHIFHFFSCKEGSRNSFSRGGVSFERFVIRYPNLTYFFLFLKEKPGKSKRLYFVAWLFWLLTQASWSVNCDRIDCRDF